MTTEIAVVENIKRFNSFAEFYPYYLSEHSNRTSRRLHFIGSCGALAFLALAIVQRNAWWLLAALVCGYAFAWVGHFFFERNKPATFQYPAYSLASDFLLFWQISQRTDAIALLQLTFSPEPEHNDTNDHSHPDGKNP